MKYKYVGAGWFYQGLPANDFDDETLTPEQRIILAVVLDAGLYKAVKDDKKEKPVKLAEAVAG